MPIYCDGFQIHDIGHVGMVDISFGEDIHRQGFGFVFDHEEPEIWAAVGCVFDNEHNPLDELVDRSDRADIE